MRVVVFLMRGTSLRLYDEAGMFDREMALYRELGRLGVRTTLVTCGDRRDLRYAGRLRGMRILCNWPGWSQDLYERRLVWLHAPWLWRADVIKADQTNGAEVALWSARRWRKPVLARCGFMWIDFVERQFGTNARESREVERISRLVFGQANHVVVTTSSMAGNVERRFGVMPQRITVIPNYVDADLFSPGADDQETENRGKRVLAIGRLHPEKNQMALVEALVGTGYSLTIVGTGELENALRKEAKRLGVNVELLGTRPHNELPGLIRHADLFVQPSLIEGHPKTVLEAMSCGVAVLGSDVPGIHDVIRHGETGWLCGTTPESIRRGIERLCHDVAFQRRLGVAARAYILDNCTLSTVAVQEKRLYDGVWRWRQT